MSAASGPKLRDDALTGFDLPALQAELDARARHGSEGYRNWRDATASWRDTLRGFYGAGLHRCG
jgi:hypothetical protein